MTKSVKNIGIAVLSVLMAVCLSMGLILYFQQTPVVMAATVNAVTKTVVAGEDDFTYAKDENGYTVVTGLTSSFVEEYSNYTGSEAKGNEITYNVRLDIPEILKTAHGDIPAGTKVDYVQEGAFANSYTESGTVGNKKISFRITDVHTPESVYWQSKTIANGGLFNIANDVTESEFLSNTNVAEGDSDGNKKIWAKMLSANDGITATVYDIDTSNLPANFIVPSPMWHDKNGDGTMDDGELFAHVELLVDEQVSNSSHIGNMVISSGVTRFFSPYVKENRIKIEDTFRSNNSNRSAMTGLHFATGRTTVLSIYGLAFQRYTGLQTITLSAGVLLADGVRAFQQDENVAVMNIASESNSNVPSFYVKGNNGAIYTGDYRYSYYDTAGYRKYLVWDYVTRYNKNLGNADFQNNTAENGDYKADAAVSQPSAAALTSNSQLSPDSGIATIAVTELTTGTADMVVWFDNGKDTYAKGEDINIVQYVKALSTNKSSDYHYNENNTVKHQYSYKTEKNSEKAFEITVGDSDIILSIVAAAGGSNKKFTLYSESSPATLLAETNIIANTKSDKTYAASSYTLKSGSNDYVLKAKQKYIINGMSEIYVLGLMAKTVKTDGISVDKSETTFDLATDSAKTETITLSTTGSATLDKFEWDILNSESESVKGSNYFDISDTLQSGNTVTVKLNADTPPEAGDYTLKFTTGASSEYTASVTIHVVDTTPAKIEIKSEDIASGGSVSYYIGQTPDPINFTAEVTGKDGNIIPDYANVTWVVADNGNGGSVKPAEGQSTQYTADITKEFTKNTVTITAAVKGSPSITTTFTFELEVKEAPKENFAWSGEAYDGGIGVPDYSVVIDFGTKDFNFGSELGNYQEKFSVINITSTSINEYVEGIVTVNTSTATNSLGDGTVKINQKSPARNIPYNGYYDPSKTGNIKITVSDKFSIKAYISHGTTSREAVFSGGEKDITVKVADENKIKNNNEEYFTGLNNGLLQLDNLAAGTYTIKSKSSSDTIHIYAIVITPTEAPDNIEADKTELSLTIPKAEETSSATVELTAVGDATAALQGATAENITISEPHDGITAAFGDYAEETATRPINIEVTSAAKAGDYTLTVAIADKYNVEIKITVVDPDAPIGIVLNKSYVTLETGKSTEFSAELVFPTSTLPENLSELLENVKWTISGDSSADSWLTGQEAKDNRSIVVLTPAKAGSYTLTATYGDGLTAKCTVVVNDGIQRVLEIPAPEYNVTDQYVAYQKLVYVPPQLKDSNGDTLKEFTFLYTATTTIGNSAFAASHIETIRIPDRISTIEEYAFRYSSLKTVYLPSNATYGNAVFGEFKDFAINKEGSDMTAAGFKTAYKNADFVLIAPSYQVYDSLLATDGKPLTGKLTDRNTTTQTSKIDDAGTIGIKYDYRSKLTYEVQIVIGDKFVTVLYNQMDGENLYVKNGNTFDKKTWSAILSGLGITDGSVYYGSVEITGDNIKKFITGNLAGVTYSEGTGNSYGLFTNTSTVEFDSWNNASSEPAAPAGEKADYAPNTNRLPASITLTTRGATGQENSGAIAVPGFQPVGDQVPVGESKTPELTVMFDFAGYPYSRIFEGFDPDAMTATYEYKGIDGHSVNGGPKKLTENSEYPYDAGTYTITIKLKDQAAAAAALNEEAATEYWEGAYNGLPVTNNDVSEKVYTLNIQKRSVTMPGDRQVLHTEATGAEVAVFENNAFYEVVKYSDKITVDGAGEKQIGELNPLNEVPYQRGSYWVALKLIDEYNLQWVGAGNQIITSKDTEYYKNVGETNVDANDNHDFVTCKLIISDSPAIPILSFVADDNVGTANLSTFTAVYRNKEYALSDIFAGYHSYSVSATITSYKIGETEQAVPNSILNAGTYTVTFKPAENYAWQVGTRGCGFVVAAGDINREYTVTVVIQPKTLATPPEQIQFAGSNAIEYAPAPDGTWTVVGYRDSDTSGAFSSSIAFDEGTYDVELELTDKNNYKWAKPESDNAAYTITKLDVRNADNLGLDNPVSNGAPLTYTGSVLASADAIDYDSVITADYRSVYKYSYQTYDESGYKTVTQTAGDDSIPTSVLNAGEYTIKFSLPELTNSVSSYWWKEAATTNNGGETDPAKSDNTDESKYYGVRYADLTVNKRATTRVRAGMVIETDISLQTQTAPLPAENLAPSVYTVSYAVNGKGSLNNSGIPNNIGTYKVTLTLTEAGYRNYYFSGTTPSESGAAGDETKYYPKSITVTLNVGVKTTAAPYVNKELTYNGKAMNIKDIITIPDESRSVIDSENSGKIISYTKPGSEEAEGTTPTEIKNAGVYVLEYKILTTADSIWSTDVPPEYESYNKLTIVSGDETYRTLHVQVTVNQAKLTLTLSAEERTYNGETNATVTGEIESGKVETDAVEVGTIVANFEDKNVGENKDITVESVTLTGDAAYNYTVELATLPEVKGNIKPAQLTVTLSAADANKEYDGTDTANVTGEIGAGSGKFGSDDVDVDTIVANFDTADAGDNKPITVTNVTLKGDDKDNYTATYSDDDLSANITQKSVAVVWNDGKAIGLTYNGDTQEISATATGVGDEVITLAVTYESNTVGVALVENKP